MSELGPVGDGEIKGEGSVSGKLPEGYQVTPLHHKGAQANRLTMQLSVVHEQIGERPKPIQGTCSLALELDEEHYSRGFTVEQEWKPVPLGHLNQSDIMLLVVENLEGKNYQVRPDAEEVAACKKRIVEVRLGPDDQSGTLQVPPTWYQPIITTYTTWIRCLEGKAKVRTTVFPK